MPIATGVGKHTDRFELKSLPGAYVVLRRMSYGERMIRKSYMSKIKVGQELQEPNNRAERRRASAQAFMAEMDLANEKVTAFEFSVSIVTHNLEYLMNADDPTSVALLDFKKPEHVKLLDGNVGEEIDALITELNDYESDEQVGKSPTSSTTSLSQELQD